MTHWIIKEGKEGVTFRIQKLPIDSVTLERCLRFAKERKNKIAHFDFGTSTRVKFTVDII